MVTTWRSAAKPFQLESNFDCLPTSIQEGILAPSLAVGAASHSAEDYHLKEVRRLLSHFEIDESKLRCAGHWPIYEPAKEAMLGRGEACTDIHNNCSGKHSFMLAAAKHLGADENYLPVEHEVQKRILERIQERTNGTVVDTVVDGCGVPCFVLPLQGMATAWAALGNEMQNGTSSLGKIGQAMMHEARYVSGTQRLDLAINQFKTEPMVTKIGAEGLICGTYPDRGLGFAIKVRTGLGSVRPLAAVEVLNHWFPDNLPPKTADLWATILNVAGNPVGRVEACWE
jgi:L-asparaginase II